MKGYRTYIIAVLIGLITVANVLGYVDDITTTHIREFLLAGGLWTLRSAL